MDETPRPRVVVSVSTSVDGRVTLRRDRLLMDDSADRIWRSMQPEGAQAAEDARSSLLAGLHGPQAVLEGSGSLVTDSAGPLTGLPEEFAEPVDALHTDFLPEEVAERPGHEMWFTVVDSRGRVRWSMKRNGEYDLLVLVARATPAPYLAYLRRERIPYLVAGGERVDLAAALRRMREKLGVTCVVSTAGGGLNGALLRAGLVDEIQLLVIPAAIGGLGTPTLFDGPELADGEVPTRLRLLFAHVGGDGMLWLRYDVVREPAPG
ncbi:deaminase [Nonomuraea sp. KC401]|uniref:RibD family protein n=1 Tax=unclassified Nonomuraea TaxID=2593643 RepID=UPI0010FE5F13|nr:MULTISPECIES: dihydrofolate reductase family protein [unclassified Nonomuraea]NBE96747.1 deaminase [Nonomuraea sp. K271]TLF78975.1 deaminase [Nonomuraea sp. KC401]